MPGCVQLAGDRHLRLPRASHREHGLDDGDLGPARGQRARAVSLAQTRSAAAHRSRDQRRRRVPSPRRRAASLGLRRATHSSDHEDLLPPVAADQLTVADDPASRQRGHSCGTPPTRRPGHGRAGLSFQRRPHQGRQLRTSAASAYRRAGQEVHLNARCRRLMTNNSLGVLRRSTLALDCRRYGLVIGGDAIVPDDDAAIEIP